MIRAIHFSAMAILAGASIFAAGAVNSQTASDRFHWPATTTR